MNTGYVQAHPDYCTLFPHLSFPLVQQHSVCCLMLLSYALGAITGQPGNHHRCRVQSRQATVQSRPRAGLNNVRYCLGPTAGTPTGVRKPPFPPTGTAATPSGAETAQERPLPSRRSKARLSDCGVVHEVCIDHRGRLPGFSPLTVDVNWPRPTPQRP